jgi:RNA polymerase sigma-70 factor, ECF subfamily
VSKNSAFIEAYRTVRRDVERFAMFLERDRDKAADLVQSSLYGAYRSWSSIATAPALKAYCITAVLRAHRKNARSDERFVRDTLDEIIVPGNLSPEEATDVQLIRDAIARLPDAERVPLILAELEGWALADIAAELSIGLSAVKMRVKRGRDHLKVLLRENLDYVEKNSHE